MTSDQPNDGPVLLLHCPVCGRPGAKLCVTSMTVVTVKCTRCHHMWATELRDLPEAMQGQVRSS
jgi:hypothetical protein